MIKKPASFIAAVGVIAASLAATPANASKMEKCYGITKAGKNDCAAKDGSHSCATYSAKDADENDWMMLPEGVCDRIVGGIVEKEPDT